MLIKIITSIKELETLKATWIDIYHKDLNATIFSSWEWTLGWLKATEENWFILAVHSSADKCVSFALLRKSNIAIHAGTSPAADHNSFICLPEHKRDADLSINKYLETNIRWNRYELLDAYDNNLDTSIQHWSSIRYKVSRLDDTPCPYLELPDSREDYLGMMSRQSRKDLIKSIRRTKRIEDFKETIINKESYEPDIKTVLSLWQNKWGDKDDSLIKTMKSIFRECFLNNKLRVTIFWAGEIPVVANLSFLDPEKQSIYSYIGGFDENYKKTSPGTAILAEELNYAFENGYKIYDFLRGNEAYKYDTFKAKDRFNQNYIIEDRARLGIRKIKKLIKIIGLRSQVKK